MMRLSWPSSTHKAWLLRHKSKVAFVANAPRMADWQISCASVGISSILWLLRQATHAPHKHATDEFFLILEGKARFYLDGKTKVVGPYTSLYCPSNIEHGISNAGENELKYLVIKKYPK